MKKHYIFFIATFIIFPLFFSQERSFKVVTKTSNLSKG